MKFEQHFTKFTNEIRAPVWFQQSVGFQNSLLYSTGLSVHSYLIQIINLKGADYALF